MTDTNSRAHVYRHVPSQGASMSEEPRVWNKRDPNRPMDAVYVGRGTPWGNPFKMDRESERDVVCDLFEQQVLPRLDVSKLRGCHLVCWCAPKRCHADALLKKAKALSRYPDNVQGDGQ